MKTSKQSKKKKAERLFEMANQETMLHVSIADDTTTVRLSQLPLLQSIKLPKSVKTVFISQCPQLTELFIPDGVKKVIVSDCPNLTVLSLYSSVRCFIMSDCAGNCQVMIAGRRK